MDINFHYYAVKALAFSAGFPEAEAQRIASFSQFVDDFDSYTPFMTINVPKWASHLTIPCYIFKLFYPVTTGFSSWFDMARLGIEANQRLIVTPFHFIPKAPLDTLPNRADWRVVPSVAGDKSLIQTLLKEARAELDEAGDLAQRNIGLMKIGMLLHIFADTYAHQRFSGFWGWENHSYLTEVFDTIGGETDITDFYYSKIYHKFPSIGHTNVNQAPDDSNVRYTMRQKINEGDSDYSAHLERNNTNLYCTAAKEIMNYLLSCRHKPAIGDSEWELLRKKMVAGFQTKYKEVHSLNKHWSKIFSHPAIHFDYSKQQFADYTVLEQGSPLDEEALQFVKQNGIDPMVYSSINEDYYRYNVAADQIRRRVVGTSYVDTYFDTLRAAMEKNEMTQKNIQQATDADDEQSFLS